MSNEQSTKADISVYEESYPVFSFLLDPMKRLSIPAAFGILGDAAGRDANRRGWGYDELTARNQAWVLIRARMQITRQPSWGERIVLRTWPKMMEGVVAYRDFQILDEERNVVMAGSTAWTVLDLTTRRLVRLTGLINPDHRLSEIHAIKENPERIIWFDNLQVAKKLTAEYGHLDMNNHVNNSRYIEWVINTLPAETLMNRQLTEVEVNFISEVKHMDDLLVLVPQIPAKENVFEGFIKNMADDRQAFAARFTFA